MCIYVYSSEQYVYLKRFTCSCLNATFQVNINLYYIYISGELGKNLTKFLMTTQIKVTDIQLTQVWNPNSLPFFFLDNKMF